MHQIRVEGFRAAAAQITKGTLGVGRIAIELDAGAIAGATRLSADELSPDLLKIDRPFACRRRGVEVKIVAGIIAPAPDAAMIRALRNAHLWSEALNSDTPLKQLASEVNVTARYVARVIPLSSLSPKIQTSILDGTQPVGLTLEQLLRNSLPLAWRAQEQALGFFV